MIQVCLPALSFLMESASSQTSSHQTNSRVQCPLQWTPSAWFLPIMTFLSVADHTLVVFKNCRMGGKKRGSLTSLVKVEDGILVVYSVSIKFEYCWKRIYNLPPSP